MVLFMHFFHIYFLQRRNVSAKRWLNQTFILLAAITQTIHNSPLNIFLILILLSITGSGWQQELPTDSSRSFGRYPERQFGNEAAIEHGKRLRHQSKNPGYFKQIGNSTHTYICYQILYMKHFQNQKFG